MKKVEFGARYKVVSGLSATRGDIVVPYKIDDDYVYFYHINGEYPKKPELVGKKVWDKFTEILDIKVAKTRLAYKIYKNKIIKEEGNFYIVRL